MTEPVLRPQVQGTFVYDYLEISDEDMTAVLNQLNTLGAAGWRIDGIVHAGGFYRFFLVQQNLPLEQSASIPVYLAGAPGATLRHIAAAGSALLKTGAGVLRSIDINTPAASNSALTFYDGTDATGAVMAVIDCTKQTANVGTAGWPFKVGCFYALTGAPDITLVYA